MTVFSAITTLFVLSTVNLGLQWYFLINGRLMTQETVIYTIPSSEIGVFWPQGTPNQYVSQQDPIFVSPWAHWVIVFCVYTEFIIADVVYW